jgi:hypothetical protein
MDMVMFGFGISGGGCRARGQRGMDYKIKD